MMNALIVIFGLHACNSVPLATPFTDAVLPLRIQDLQAAIKVDKLIGIWCLGVLVLQSSRRGKPWRCAGSNQQCVVSKRLSLAAHHQSETLPPPRLRLGDSTNRQVKVATIYTSEYVHRI